jgi:hypothetical protein
LSTGNHETLQVPGPVVSVMLAVADASAAAVPPAGRKAVVAEAKRHFRGGSACLA